jgi:hypothetical protein
MCAGTGAGAVWLPLISGRAAQRLHDLLRALAVAKMLQSMGLGIKPSLCSQVKRDLKARTRFWIPSGDSLGPSRSPPAPSDHLVLLCH